MRNRELSLKTLLLSGAPRQYLAQEKAKAEWHDKK